MIIPQYRAGCPHVTHPSATKISEIPAEALISFIFVRLACVKHAASVHPEPGSNSQIKIASRIVMSNFVSSFRRKLRILSYSFHYTILPDFFRRLSFVIFYSSFLELRINFGS